MNCNEIIELLRKIAPEQIACSWDNVGLLCGRREKQVNKLMLCLDVTDRAVEQAVTEGVDMIVSHHPLLFRPVKRVTDEDMIGRRLLGLIQGDISYYAMHTSFDCSEYGMAYAAAQMLCLQEQSILDEPVAYQDALGRETQGGIGRVGFLPEEMTVYQLIEQVKNCFAIQGLYVYGENLEQKVRRIAISPGSGRDQIGAALQAGAQVLITGDISHHAGLDAKEQGLVLIDAGHYNIEHIFSDYMAEYLHKQLSDEIEVVQFQENCPYGVY